MPLEENTTGSCPPPTGSLESFEVRNRVTHGGCGGSKQLGTVPWVHQVYWQNCSKRSLGPWKPRWRRRPWKRVRPQWCVSEVAIRWRLAKCSFGGKKGGLTRLSQDLRFPVVTTGPRPFHRKKRRLTFFTWQKIWTFDMSHMLSFRSVWGSNKKTPKSLAKMGIPSLLEMTQLVKSFFDIFVGYWLGKLSTLLRWQVCAPLRVWECSYWFCFRIFKWDPFWVYQTMQMYMYVKFEGFPLNSALFGLVTLSPCGFPYLKWSYRNEFTVHPR